MKLIKVYSVFYSYRRNKIAKEFHTNQEISNTICTNYKNVSSSTAVPTYVFKHLHRFYEFMFNVIIKGNDAPMNYSTMGVYII